MTDMKRITVSLTDEIVAAIAELKETERFKSCTYSEIIRILVQRGLEKAGDV